MNRRCLLAGLLAAVALPAVAWAQGFADQIVQQLRSQGYSGINVSNTWLGRTRIVGQSGQGSREIIIDPRTGEILRDLFQGSGGRPQIIDDRSGGGRDDGTADRGREDTSGHGGDDNSGHGGDDRSGHGSGGSDHD